jgi:hypothetical protein
MKKFTFLIVILAGLQLSFSQNITPLSENLKPYRVGLKIGTPIVIGLDLEYVTPLFENRVAPFLDLTSLKYNNAGDVYKSNIFEIGSNVYLNDKGNGKGLYSSLSYQHINFKMDRFDYVTDDGRQFTGNAKSETKANTFNVKIGAKLGQKFYFRTEIGYGFGTIPESIESTGMINGLEVTIDESFSQDLKDFPIASKNGMLLFNFGFGYEFDTK